MARGRSPDEVEARWDPPPRVRTSCREKKYSDLAASYHSIAAVASNAPGCLKYVIPAGWSGEPAQACGGCMDDLTEHTDGIATSVPRIPPRRPPGLWHS